MDNKQNLHRKHFILDIPVLGAVLSGFAGFVFAELICGTLLGGILSVILRSLTGSDFDVTYITSIIGGILTLFIHKLWFRGEFKGSFGEAFLPKKSTLAVIAVCMGLDILLSVLSIMSLNGRPPGISMILLAAVAGICEETAFRGLPISVAMRRRDKRAIVTAVLTSSLCFSLIHVTNLFMGAGLIPTLVQVLMAFGMGVFTAAVYLRTGNLLITIVWHFVHDYIAFWNFSDINESGIMESIAPVDAILSLSSALIFFMGGIFLLKGKTDEIIEVWNERWNYDNL